MATLYKAAFTADLQFKNRWELDDANFSVLQIWKPGAGHRCLPTVTDLEMHWFSQISRSVLKLFPLHDLLQCLVPKQGLYL